MYCYLVEEMQGLLVVCLCVNPGVEVAIAGDYAAQRGQGVGFCFFCEAEIVSEVNHACGVGLVEGNAAFVGEGGHGQKSAVKGSPVIADAATVLISHGIPPGIL